MRQPTELHMEAKCLAIWPCMEKPAAGTGSPAGSPYNLGINRSKKIPETELSKIPFLGSFHPTLTP